MSIPILSSPTVLSVTYMKKATNKYNYKGKIYKIHDHFHKVKTFCMIYLL